MFEIDVSSSAVRAADNLVARLQNLNAPLAKTGALLENKAKKRFQSQKDPGGKPWAPLKPATVAEKKRLGKASSILTRDALLSASIAFNVSGNEVRVKPSEEYGIFHQTGSKKALPARPFMGFEADDPDKIGQIFRDHLEGN
ncbi:MULTISPECIES: phage virion morphogenesis protein [Cyanophyceae]|uniref:phage virion morphogenesis protein n=1 Tax=Cyanophyceae TaxID=3028117 RepID=UPI0016893A96|nr:MULTISPECIES: phage virion morphogenesis protein [Cyanophyceae]MBD1918898.1 phage virion morphogenesis protein [Phormidium sp. FACHB-77]MBD2033260.1 phage virion morphogenesis protein [Phormidium sp. FACHB-322]MBD2053807.1 phage virion morphogenesis protein [Leptolyngbya sp. FACHB-60]